MATHHIVRSFDEELHYLRSKIIEMGHHAETMVARSVTAMITKDVSLAHEIIAQDLILDEAEREIDDKAIAIIAKRQPMAVDLREIIGAIRISGDLERIGDMAKNIAKRVKAIAQINQPVAFYQDMQDFSALALSQLRDVCAAYASYSLDPVSVVLKRDEEIDTRYTTLFGNFLAHMAQDRDKITVCTHLLFCAKNIERVGDHATNIAEMLHYIMTGLPPSRERIREDLSHEVGARASPPVTAP